MDLPRLSPPRSTASRRHYLAVGLLLIAGCGESRPRSPIDADPKLAAQIQGELDTIAAETKRRYFPINWQDADDLLRKVDRIEAHLTDPEKNKHPRFLNGLEEAEEDDHFREVIRRWETQFGRPFRAEIDSLKTAIAGVGRIPPQGELRNKVGVLDVFYKIEKAELIERRTRLLNDKAQVVFAKYRAQNPAIVRYYESILKPTPVPTPTPSPPAPTATK